jgi:hypothetical protein
MARKPRGRGKCFFKKRPCPNNFFLLQKRHLFCPVMDVTYLACRFYYNDFDKKFSLLILCLEQTRGNPETQSNGTKEDRAPPPDITL